MARRAPGDRPHTRLAGVACLAVTVLVLSACDRGSKPPSQASQAEAINRLELRMEQLERRLGQQLPPLTDPSDKAPAGPVKSLTLRVGTVDDRLRIYWADGSSSDLPCTKEQSTWACG